MGNALELKREPKHVRIKNQFLSAIRANEYEDGESFYTEREICEKFNVSVTTARRVLNDLKAMGLLERRRGAGTFIRRGGKPKDEVANKVIGVLLYQPAMAFVPSMVDVMKGISQVASEHEYDLKILIPSQASILQLVERSHVNGLITTHAELSDEDIQELKQIVPCLATFTKGMFLEGIHTVSSNEVHTIFMIGEYLAGLGHRRIAFFHGPKEYEFTHNYLLGYHLIVEHFNLDRDDELLVETGRRGVERVEDGFVPTQGELDKIRGLLRSPNRPTAMIIPSWKMAEETLRIASEFDLVIGKDLSVVCLAQPMDIERDNDLPKITHIKTDNVENGRIAARILFDLIDGKSCPKVTFEKPELKILET